MICKHCGGTIELNIDNLQAYCPYCGDKLLIEISELKDLMLKREETKQVEIKENSKVQIEKIQATENTAIQIGLLIVGTIVTIMFLIFMTFNK